MAKILIVDDEPYIRMLLEEALDDLEDDGVELLFAEDGEAALAMAEEHKPSLLLLDVMMPRMNGFDVCRGIKESPALQSIHVIMLTAKGQEYDRKRGFDAGADDYITKPFNPVAVITKAREVLGLA